jgi:hypothetical protein
VKKTKEHPLVGKLFHAIEADKTTITWRAYPCCWHTGRIKAEVSPGLFLLQLFTGQRVRSGPRAGCGHGALADIRQCRGNERGRQAIRRGQKGSRLNLAPSNAPPL